MKKAPLYNVGKIALLLMALLLLTACPEKKPTKPDVVIDTGTIAGRVLGDERAALEGVTVSVGTNSTLTDSEGQFILPGVEVGSHVLVNFAKEGYIGNQKNAVVSKGRTSYLENSLRSPITRTFASTIGSELKEGVNTITIPADAFVKPDGSSFIGNVLAEYRFYDPTQLVDLNAFPGTYSGIREDGTETPFESYGFFYASFYSADNPDIHLQLADGKKAGIHAKIPESLLDNAPDTMPLWHYDEEKGKWYEEGFGTKEEEFYDGEVSHFSFWNYDAPITIDDQATLTGRVIYGDSTPAAGANVLAMGVSYSGYTTAYTNGNGEFSIVVKASSQVQITAYSGVHTSGYGDPIDTPASGGTLNLDALVIENISFVVRGRLINEAGEPLGNDGALFMMLDNEGMEIAHNWLYPDADGRFEFTDIDMNLGTSFTVRFVSHTDPNLYSDAYQYILPQPGDVYDFGNVIMKEGGKIKGRAKDSDGNWLANRYVDFVQIDGEGGEGSFFGAETDADGYFILTGPFDSTMTDMVGTCYSQGTYYTTDPITLSFPASGNQTNIGTVIFNIVPQ
ncbi:MAG: carboxypeptidase-like regulatory domain-containing protein [Candidatus Cloacimonadaceae bacterium]